MEAMEYLVVKKEKIDARKELKKEERFKKAFALQEERIRMKREKDGVQKGNGRREDHEH
jgi:hypothetical protein